MHLFETIINAIISSQQCKASFEQSTLEQYLKVNTDDYLSRSVMLISALIKQLLKLITRSMVKVITQVHYHYIMGEIESPWRWRHRPVHAVLQSVNVHRHRSEHPSTTCNRQYLAIILLARLVLKFELYTGCPEVKCVVSVPGAAVGSGQGQF